MTKKRILSIVMLVVLAAGIALAVYGVMGRNIYTNAAAMMGSDLKTAMTYIQDPASMTEIGTVEKIGADQMKGFLRGLGLDGSAVDAAVEERAGMKRPSPTPRTGKNSWPMPRRWMKP